MLYDTLVAMIAMMVLVALFAGFHLLAERARAVARRRGEACPEPGVRCLGCFASGRCAGKRRG